MIEFFEVFLNSDIVFLRYAVVAAFFSSVIFGFMGTYVVTRRISYLAGSISHTVLGGIGLGLYLSRVKNISWFTPMVGAFLVSIFAAFIVNWVSTHSKEREDTIIGTIWAFGMGGGLLFIAKTPGHMDPMSYLFGNILMISYIDLWAVLILSIIVLFIFFVFYNIIICVGFDEEFARLRGINTRLFNLLMLCLIAVSIVTMVRIVGIILVIAMLTIPAAISQKFTRNFRQMAVCASAVSFVSFVVGLYLSYITDLPSSATIVTFVAVVYFVFLGVFSKKV